MRNFLSLAFLALGLLASTTPARACIWDREIITQEKQFKSNYLDQPVEPQPRGHFGIDSMNVPALALGGLGGALLLAGVVVAFVRGPGAGQFSRSTESTDGTRA